MPSTYIIPLEIEETIIDFLAEDDEDHSALKRCSLVCQAFLPVCRKYIFASIVLNDHSTKFSPTTHALGRLLSERPEIADYILKLDYTIRVLDSNSLSIPESLKRISRLEFLTIRDSNTLSMRINWTNHPIRPTMLHLLHLPTITHFKMSRVKNFVLSDLVPCVNLKTLYIGHYTTCSTEITFPAALPEHPIQPNEFVMEFGTATAIMKLCTARRPDGQSVIDFRSLSKITVDFEMPYDTVASMELFRRCEMLTDVHISFLYPRDVRSSLADMLRPSMQTLKHIFVNVHVEDVDADPLFGIPSELEDMRTKNIIESVTIRVTALGNCSRGDDWGRLDEVLTSSGWFELKWVYLVIVIVSHRSDNELELALRELPKTQFRRLSASNFVSFDFEVDAI